MLARRLPVIKTIKTPEQQIAELAAEVAVLKAELAVQKGPVAALLKRIYGPSSEKLDHNQLFMEFLSEEAKKPAAAAGIEDPAAAEILIAESPATKPRARRTNKLSESLKGLPTAFTLEIIKRLTHIRKNEVDAVPVTAPLEPCLHPGSVLTPSLGAHLLSQKFCHHSAFHREQ